MVQSDWKKNHKIIDSITKAGWKSILRFSYQDYSHMQTIKLGYFFSIMKIEFFYY